MISEIQTQDAVVSVSAEKDVQYTIVQDTELAHVGGGNSSVHF